MFRRKKKEVVPHPPEERVLFGSVTVPRGAYSFRHEGYNVHHYRYSSWDATGSCEQCGDSATAQVHESWSWEEVKRSVGPCKKCKWYEGKYEEDLAAVADQIEALETKQEALFTALAALPGVKCPKSLSWDDLEGAGLILHRKDQRSVLGFILIDYSREEMHGLVKAIDGRLEPFSRGFKLFLGAEYYKLFPGSYGWESHYHGQYTYYNHQTYLDFLRERQEKIEARAEKVRAKIETHVVA